MEMVLLIIVTRNLGNDTFILQIFIHVNSYILY